MSVHNLDALFAPSRVAVVGASANPSSVGHIVLGNLVDAGFDGVVYPVNPRAESIRSIQAYPSVADTPVAPDLAIVCTPAPAVPDVVRSCGEAGVRGIVVISAGFREAGDAGRALEDRVAEQLAAHPGMRLMGPNCLGVIVPRLGLNASFAAGTPADGHLAVVTQSGALATAMIDWSLSAGIGFSRLVSLGNMLDVDLGDVIDDLAADAQTRALVLYVENVTNPRKFMSAARAFTRTRPIVVYKGGRHPASAQAAISHTGAMAGADAVYDAAFERAGIVRVLRVQDLFATAELLSRERPPAGPRLGIVTNAGGPAVMAADALLDRGGTLAELAPQTMRALEAALPPSWSRGNPVDVLGDAPPERFSTAVATLVADPEVDAVLVILTPQAMTDPDGAADAVATARAGHRKPVLAVWMGGRSVAEGERRLGDAGIATYRYPEEAVDAFLALVAYRRGLDTLYETPRAIPGSFRTDRAAARTQVSGVVEGGRRILSEADAKTLLDAYGIPVTAPLAADTADDAVAAAGRLGYPVVLKIRSPDITHKTDVGGVVVDLQGPGEVRAAFDRMLATVRERRPDAELHGATVQPMVSTPGQELILGARQDATFGAVIMVGAGGVAAELLADRALGLPPLNERLARSMLESLRMWPLLTGHRGRAPVDRDALLEAIMRVSYLVADLPEVIELDVNPLLATADGVVALDARAVVEPVAEHPAGTRFAHLAIRPYPDELTRSVTTRDGLRATLRAIRPEDEPLWHQMLDACSAETIHSRFRAAVRHTHRMATRYCFIDYDRELAIVAEVHQDGERRLAGVVRLVADPDRERAEYAILVADPWQGRGLAHELTRFALEVAARWGVREVFAETMAANHRMIGVLRAHGFEVGSPDTGGVVHATRAAGRPG